MPRIKDFEVKYEPLNKENTFSPGDTITGIVTFTITKDTKIKCLYVKAKGDANVHWSESEGTDGDSTSYFDHRRYYKAKEFLVVENKNGTVLSKGDHRYKFKLKIPKENIPPSFKGFHGEIAHVVQAMMRRSGHIPSFDQRKLNFVSRTLVHTHQSPQTGSVDKSVGTFSKGQVHLDATVNKRVCSPGETLHVIANVSNKSSKKMRIKFSIDEKTEYRAHQHGKITNATVCKIVGETIEPDFEGKISCQVTVPVDTKLSIHNCEIITVEFYLKVYLDIKFAIDPVVALPLIIAAPDAIIQHGQHSHGFLNSAGAMGGPSCSDFPPPFSGPYRPPGPPNAYGYPPPGPNPYPVIPGGVFYNSVPAYNNQMPPQPVPYGYPAAPFMPYSVQPQANTTNSQFSQDQTPPTYLSLYPQSTTDMDKKTQL